MRKVDFEKIFWTAVIPISKELLHPDNVTVEFLEDYFKDTVTLAVKAQIWGEEVGTYKHPASWFEMFKEAHFPRWLLRRYPVKYKVINFTCLYPNWAPSIDGQKFSIVIKDKV